MVYETKGTIQLLDQKINKKTEIVPYHNTEM